jgi:hypothetical protein
MLTLKPHHQITWEKLPDDFVLDDEPVDNINQPLLAAALTESLEIASKLLTNALTTTNYGICATLNRRFVVKAPDWAYVPKITVSREEFNRSYTPKLQGDIPAIVDENGKLLLWGVEKTQQLEEKAERLAAQLRAAGIEPEI